MIKINLINEVTKSQENSRAPQALKDFVGQIFNFFYPPPPLVFLWYHGWFVHCRYLITSNKHSPPLPHIYNIVSMLSQLFVFLKNMRKKGSVSKKYLHAYVEVDCIKPHIISNSLTCLFIFHPDKISDSPVFGEELPHILFFNSILQNKS